MAGTSPAMTMGQNTLLHARHSLTLDASCGYSVMLPAADTQSERCLS
jgi:hypothetical protein